MTLSNVTTLQATLYLVMKGPFISNWCYYYPMKTRDLDTALQAFRDKGGTLRTRDLIALGVHTDALYTLRNSGQVVELSRGLYRLAEASEAEHPDLAVVAA